MLLFLTDEIMKQETALKLLKAGENVFLTGSAGAGKTYTLNQYINYLKARKVPVAITASTGIAATHMNGMTIHTWAGIGIKDTLTDDDLKRMKERKYLKEHLENAQVLIIDEISMLHAKQLNLVNQVLKYILDYSTEEQAAIRILDQNSSLIALCLYEQIKLHFVQKVLSYGEAKVLPFVKIENIHLGERTGCLRKTLYDPIPTLHQIRRFVFHGFTKACHEAYSFDSGTERNFAQILEQDAEVIRWMRPASTQFNIHWGKDSRRYEPDFVVETEHCIYLVETKASKELSHEEVKAKAEAARQYCHLASEYTTQHGGKPWEYLLVSHLDIEPTFSLKYIRDLSKGNQDLVSEL